MLLRPRYGWLGMLVMPIAATTVLVPLVFTPFIVYVVLDVLLRQGPLEVLRFFGLFAAIYGGMALVAVLLQHERKVHLAMVPLYRFIYEPLRIYLLYSSFGTALRGVRLGWNKVERTGHVEEGALQPQGVRA
jgi:biofilm PGA synthesis N-glycosyltransferase PgaC